MPEIVQWDTLSERFQDGLLLGNGASMAVHPGFGYSSLYSEACRLRLVDESVQAVFDAFKTTDFELVLRRLWHATLVNEALNIERGPAEVAYEAVRTALIATIRETHVAHEKARPHLDHIYPFIQQFKTIVSLNYDLIVYWAAMHGNATLGSWFKDAFIASAFREDWEKVREPYGAQGATLFFYPHGNLVLARDAVDQEKKIAAGAGGALLDSILDQWMQGKYAPIFVCEGTADHKKNAINSSSYLQRIYREVFPRLGGSLVIYGWDLSEQDEHIIEQLGRTIFQRVAVSVHKGSAQFMIRAEAILQGQGVTELYFFDAASPGCWNNPAAQAQSLATPAMRVI